MVGAESDKAKGRFMSENKAEDAERAEGQHAAGPGVNDKEDRHEWAKPSPGPRGGDTQAGEGDGTEVTT